MSSHLWNFLHQRIRHHIANLYSVGIGLSGVVTLIALTRWDALFAQSASLVFFIALSFILKRAGFHALPEMTHSLVGIVDLAAVLIFGPVLGAWVAAISGFLYLFLNAVRREKHDLESVVEMPLFNAGLKIGMAYASTYLYTALGGTFPPRQVTLDIVPPLLGAALAWFILDNLGWALIEFFHGGIAALQNFVQRTLRYAVLMELLPLPFSIVIAVTYTEQDAGLFLLIAAGLVGTAIVVQRFADTRARLERRSNDLTALNEFARAVAQATFDTRQVIDLLYEYARRIAPADVYRIELFDHPNTSHSARLVLQATPHTVQHLDETQSSSLLYDYFQTHREPIRAIDVARAFVYPMEAIAIVRAISQHVPTTRSLLIVPLWAGDELLGTLALFSERPRAFFAIHAHNLTSICAQAAVTIQNARLYATERQRAAQLAIVSEVSRQVAALLDLDELLPRIVHLIRDRFGYSHVHLFTVDAEQRRVVFRASTHPRGEDWRARNIGYRIGLEGLVGWVAATGKPVLVNDVSQEPRFAPYPDKAVDETQSEIVVPLTIGDEVIGVLDVESDRRNAFTEDDLFILKTLAAQVAIAIEDARLYNLQKEEAYYLNALLQVAQNLSATMDLDEALETIVRITPLLVGVARCAIFLYDAPTRAFVPAKAYGLTRALQAEFQRLHFPADDDAGMFGTLLREQSPLVIDDTRHSDWREIRSLQQFGARSSLIAPLVTRGEVIGALWVDQGERPSRFTTREIQVVMAIASQAAIAIEGVRLAREAEDKRRIEYELGLARQIQTSFLPEKCPVIAGYAVHSMWQTAREVSGDFYDFVLLPGGRVAFTIADVSDKGIAAAMFMALARTILRTMTIGKPTPRETIERANDIILADARSDMFVTVFHGVLDPHTHRFTYVNAGHNPPLLYRAARKEVMTVKGHGIALGVMPDIAIEEHTLDFEPGDLLLMYTDGVTDAINAQEEEFGTERLADLVSAHAHQTPAELIAEITRAVTDFAGEGIHFDDVTMVALKRDTD